MEKKSNHRTNVVRIGEPRVHTNADSLEIFDIGGYQIVAKKGNFKAGDLAVYIQPDSVVPQTAPFEWIWKDHVGIDGLVPERRRRITVKKLRGEYSEGLLMPVVDFGATINDNGAFAGLGWSAIDEGDDVSDLIDVTHYDPDAGRERAHADTANAPKIKRKTPKTLKGWFYFILFKLGFRNAGGQSYAMDVPFEAPVYDVEAFKNFKNVLQEGELVTVTEKIHGSNARYVVVDGEFYCGSRTQWKKKGDNVWWNAAAQCLGIEVFCRSYPGQVLYGEVTPTQGQGFDYGCKKGEARFFAFDVRTPNGEWLDPRNAAPMEVPCAPFLYLGKFSDELLKLADGQSRVPGANHIREGCVIRPVTERSVRGLGRVHLKVVSNAFLDKDSR